MKIKTFRSVVILGKLKYYLDLTSLLKFYYALIHCHINCGLIIWGNSYLSYLTKLRILKTKVIRIVNNRSWHTNTFLIYQKYNTLSLSQLIKFEIAKFISTCLKNCSNPHLTTILFYQKKHIFIQPNFANYDQLAISFFKTNRNQNSIKYTDPLI